MSSLLSAVAPWPSWAAASESNSSCPFIPTIIPLVFRQKASVSVICPNIAAVSGYLPCARHRSQPCPCAAMPFNAPLSLLCRYYLDILKSQFNSEIREYTILQFCFIGWGAVISRTEYQKTPFILLSNPTPVSIALHPPPQTPSPSP